MDASSDPVLTLPSEIVSEIFIHFLPVYPETPPIIGRLSPTVLGQICQKWRAIAFGTPNLWRGISLSIANGKRLDQKLRLLELWLRLSGSCPLSITMDLRNAGSERQLPFTQALAVHCARWEHLWLCSPAQPFPLTETPLALLRTLGVSATRVPPGNDGMSTSSVHAASLLRSVAVSIWHEHYVSLYPWAQLTSLVVYFVLPHHCVAILAQASALVSCTFYISQHGVAQFSPAITHPSLSTLILFGTPPQHMGPTILDPLILPALKNLQISEDLLRASPAPLVSLIARSGCTLQAVYITSAVAVLPEVYRAALPEPAAGRLVFDAHLLGIAEPFSVLPRPMMDEESEDEAEEGR
ncbi:hypothetical protein C8R46DRAFT_1346378 [Mycena filopes]|nr:hypothetical protein C8R46DRAFT_1346378 [Mycena filopes]